MKNMTIGDREYPVVGVVKTKSGMMVPLVDMPMMSDERWNELAKEHPATTETVDWRERKGQKVYLDKEGRIIR